MDEQNFKDREDRYPLPVKVDFPEFSDDYVLAENVSANGVKLIVSRRLEPGAWVECTVRVAGETCDRCRGQVVWVRENGTVPATWSVGLHMELVDPEP